MTRRCYTCPGRATTALPGGPVELNTGTTSKGSPAMGQGSGLSRQSCEVEVVAVGGESDRSFERE